MTRTYPIALNLGEKRCLVVGGGPVGERKVAGLLEADAAVRLVSPTVTSRLADWAAAGRIEWISEGFRPEHLDGTSLVFAATDSREVNAQVVRSARAAALPVNSADAPEEGDFLVPAVVRRGDFCLSISTGGSHPMLAARLADEMEARFGEEYGAYVELLGEMRDYIKASIPDTGLRRTALAALLDSEAELRAQLRPGAPRSAKETALEVIAKAVSPSE